MQLEHKHQFKDYDRFLVGFDHFFDKMAKFRDGMEELSSNYPPFNIKKVSDNKYLIEVALAGFGTNEIEIELLDDRLVVSSKVEQDRSNFDWLYKGIADRSFKRQFKLADNVEVKGAEYFNGLLKIWLEQIIPESRKPKKIEISTP
jgi:molecular chaperone IbpA